MDFFNLTVSGEGILSPCYFSDKCRARIKNDYRIKFTQNRYASIKDHPFGKLKSRNLLFVEGTSAPTYIYI